VHCIAEKGAVVEELCDVGGAETVICINAPRAQYHTTFHCSSHVSAFTCAPKTTQYAYNSKHILASSALAQALQQATTTQSKAAVQHVCLTYAGPAPAVPHRPSCLWSHMCTQKQQIRIQQRAHTCVFCDSTSPATSRGYAKQTAVQHVCLTCAGPAPVAPHHPSCS
jgi:hypothetical protein